ncbi:hypothetical protein Hanom_Chr12g01131991 [Helianthus anomalus]
MMLQDPYPSCLCTCHTTQVDALLSSLIASNISRAFNHFLSLGDVFINIQGLRLHIRWFSSPSTDMPTSFHHLIFVSYTRLISPLYPTFVPVLCQL